MAEVFAGSLDDPRVAITLADVGATMRAGAGRYDAILLDVDNGPEGLTIAANDGLYNEAGLAVARAALKPGGVLAVWSQGPDKSFTQRLRRAGFAVEEVAVRAAARPRRAACDLDGGALVLFLKNGLPGRPALRPLERSSALILRSHSVGMASRRMLQKAPASAGPSFETRLRRSSG